MNAHAGGPVIGYPFAMVSCYLSTCPQSHRRLRDAVRKRWSHLVSEWAPVWAVLIDDRPALVVPTPGRLVVVTGGLRESRRTVPYTALAEVGAANSVLTVVETDGRRTAMTFFDAGDAARSARLIAEQRALARGIPLEAIQAEVLPEEPAAGEAVPVQPTPRSEIRPAVPGAPTRPPGPFLGDRERWGDLIDAGLGDRPDSDRPDSDRPDSDRPDPDRPDPDEDDPDDVPGGEGPSADDRSATEPEVPQAVGQTVDHPAAEPAQDDGPEDAYDPVAAFFGPPRPTPSPLPAPPLPVRRPTQEDYVELAAFLERDLLASAQEPIEREVAFLLARSGGAPLAEPTPAAEGDEDGPVVDIPAQTSASDAESVLLVTTDDVPGRTVTATLGDVLGLVTSDPADPGRSAHELARDRLAQAALRRGANAVVGLRFWTSSSVRGEVGVYGTAVRLAPAEQGAENGAEHTMAESGS